MGVGSFQRLFFWTVHGSEGELPRSGKRSPSGGFSFGKTKENGVHSCGELPQSPHRWSAVHPPRLGPGAFSPALEKPPPPGEARSWGRMPPAGGRPTPGGRGRRGGSQGGRGNFSAARKVYITVWKTLWKMCKTPGNGGLSPVAFPLWKNLRNNIFRKKRGRPHPPDAPPALRLLLAVRSDHGRAQNAQGARPFAAKERRAPPCGPLPRRNAEPRLAEALPPQEYPEPRFTRDRYKTARSRISTPMPMRITPPSRPLRRERTVPNRRPRASPAMQMKKVTAAMMREDASAAAGP